MIANPSDKAGLHILLKLACLVVILAGIHAARSEEHTSELQSP